MVAENDCEVKEIRVQGLFGRNDCKVTFNEEQRLVLVYGANGVGKSTFFKIAKAATKNDINKLKQYIFKKVSIVYSVILTNEFMRSKNYQFEVMYCKEKPQDVNNDKNIKMYIIDPVIKKYIEEIVCFKNICNQYKSVNKKIKGVDTQDYKISDGKVVIKCTGKTYELNSILTKQVINSKNEISKNKMEIDGLIPQLGKALLYKYIPVDSMKLEKREIEYAIYSYLNDNNKLEEDILTKITENYRLMSYSVALLGTDRIITRYTKEILKNEIIQLENIIEKEINEICKNLEVNEKIYIIKFKRQIEELMKEVKIEIIKKIENNILYVQKKAASLEKKFTKLLNGLNIYAFRFKIYSQTHKLEETLVDLCSLLTNVTYNNKETIFQINNFVKGKRNYILDALLVHANYFKDNQSNYDSTDDPIDLKGKLTMLSDMGIDLEKLVNKLNSGKQKQSISLNSNKINKESKKNRLLLDVITCDADFGYDDFYLLNRFLKILDYFFEMIGKKVKFGEEGILITYENEKNDKSIPLVELSSGEKHLIILLYKILFSNCNLCLVDEPEISLHVEWQRGIVDKINELLNGMLRMNQLEPHIIVATHSPQIINGNDDILQRLVTENER